MKLALYVTAAALCAPVFAASLTEGERGRALSELHASRKQFLDAVAGLSDAQWNFKPSDTSWSIAECAEHIALSEDAFFELVTKKVLAQPAHAPQSPDELKNRDEFVLKTMVDRTTKAQAPAQIQPKHTWPSRNALVEHFKRSRARMLDYVRTTNDDLRSHSLPHPLLKELDGYQWILVDAAHTARHTAQIEEVKANPRYPK